jgi:uracil-DNA glycosylase
MTTQPPTTRRHDPGCRTCPRLVKHLEQVRTDHPGYFCGPVPPFGVERPDLLVVGLAPGLHGANATGRPFTGDHAGIILYQTLHQFGFATGPVSTHVGDGLVLRCCRIANAVKCLPPANKPLPQEVRACNAFLGAELEALPPGAVILALGKIAHDAILLASGVGRKRYPFAHGAEHVLPGGARLLASYHCSRYNTQTRRLTPEMFHGVFRRIRTLLDQGRP